MPAPLYMDVHVLKAVTNQLRRRGVHVSTAFEDSSHLLDDAVLLEKAQLGRVLVTQDIRFSVLAALWQSAGRHFAGLVFVHQLEVSIGQMVKDLEIISLASLPQECENQIYRLPL